MLHTSEIDFLSWFPYGFELGETLFNLSIGYLVSCIFYYVIVYIPNEKKRIMAKKISQKRIDKIWSLMDITINYYLTEKKLSREDMDCVIEESFSTMKVINRKDKMDHFFHRYDEEINDTMYFHTGEFTELSFLKANRGFMKTFINELFSIPAVTYIEYELVILLEELNNSNLFRCIEGLEYDSRARTEGFGQHMFEFYKIYKSLSKYTTVHYCSYTENPPKKYWAIKEFWKKTFIGYEFKEESGE